MRLLAECATRLGFMACAILVVGYVSGMYISINYTPEIVTQLIAWLHHTPPLPRVWH